MQVFVKDSANTNLAVNSQEVWQSALAFDEMPDRRTGQPTFMNDQMEKKVVGLELWEELFWSGERKIKLTKFTCHVTKTELILLLIGQLQRRYERSLVNAKILDIVHMTKQL